MNKTLDLITIGRAGVDLYGAQVGGRLEDMGSFRKYIGGSPTNTAVGGARLGLRTGLLTRVGADHMGRFIAEQLAREGVDTKGVISDPARLTALVILGIRDRQNFPLIFYRENCADMALCEDDIDEALIAEARSVVATGTHLSHPRTEAAVLTITGQQALLGGQPELDRLIRLRMPYVEPLNHVQIELIRRRRAGDDDPRVREGILLALNGVAAGLRNSG